MLTNRLYRRTARILSRGGFTLVELLVVIGIIAILAGVALGPITNGIKKAKQSGGMQTTRTIAVAEFAFSNDNNGSYPDTANQSGGSGTAAAAVAQPLIAGGYTSDPSIYYISGGTAVKYTGSAAATAIAAGNISFDFAGANNGVGVNSNFPDQCLELGRRGRWNRTYVDNRCGNRDYGQARRWQSVWYRWHCVRVQEQQREVCHL
jgi:prepilin-type N-terminal cleavage/methylation domain-containing protein